MKKVKILTSMLLITAVCLTGCGPNIIRCPGTNEPVNLRKNKRMFTVSKKEYEVSLKGSINILKVLEIGSGGIEFKNKVKMFRETLTQESALIENLMELNYQYFAALPCDLTARKNYYDFSIILLEKMHELRTLENNFKKYDLISDPVVRQDSIISLISKYKLFTTETAPVIQDTVFISTVPVLTVTPSKLSFSAYDTPKTVTVTTSTDWNAGSDGDWLTVTPATTLTVTPDANTSLDGQTATITLSGMGVTLQTINVEQAGASIKPEMVLVEGGIFSTGCTPEPENGRENTVKSDTLGDFEIGKYLITQAQWNAVMGVKLRDQAKPNAPVYGEGDNYPMYYVNCEDVRQFIDRLNEMTGSNYRLPEETEWEYAARGGRHSRGYIYSGSNSIDEVAWYRDNIPGQTDGAAGYGAQPVGRKAPNELGIYDMSGNVYEWCSDWSRDDSDNPQTGSADPGNGYVFRLTRGGCWDKEAETTRVCNRWAVAPHNRSYYIGFRLARSV